MPRVRVLHDFCVHSITVEQFHRLHWVPDRIEQLSNHALIFFQYDTEGDILPPPLRIIAEEQTVVVVVYRVLSQRQKVKFL